MDKDKEDLFIKVGRLAETRSFTIGFRGAWFRCKIKKINSVLLSLDYYDFTKEKLRPFKLYQKPSRKKDAELELMMRPQYPALYNEGEVPDISSISEVAVIVNNAWREGDLVDWLEDSCYWSGKLTKVLGNDKFKMDLFPPPHGEGRSYDVFGKDLRPSLDWSPEHGWTLPKPAGRNDLSSCARLVNLGNQGLVMNLTLRSVDEDSKDLGASAVSNTSSSCSPPSHIPGKKAKRPLSCSSFVEEETLEIDKHQTHNATQRDINNTNCSDDNSSLQVENASVEVAENRDENDAHHDNDPSKKMKTDLSIYTNTMSSNVIEAAILDLEELTNRVKWIKGILQFGMPLSNSKQPSWKFVEQQPPSSRK
ncbi:Agenet domain-containing protein [Euphorbia peplus]|nr:Agenet domain-containing protein [Euphorbia peplus]